MTLCPSCGFLFCCCDNCETPGKQGCGECAACAAYIERAIASREAKEEMRREGGD